MEEKYLKVIEEFKKKTEKECYKISIVDGEPTILDDKIGGYPYLPIGVEYPKDTNGNPMPLLLQVNLKNIDLPGYPKKGILEIFTDKDLAYPCDYKIKYFDEDLEYQTEFPTIDTSTYITSKCFKIDLTKTVNYMSISDYRFLPIFIPIVNEIFCTNLANYEGLDKFFNEFPWYEKFCEGIGNQYATIGGYPDFTQTDPREYDLKDKDECLFNLDSCLEDNIMIGDMGIIFALISQHDIESCNFENAVVDWDCC